MKEEKKLFGGLEDPRSTKNQKYPFEYMMLVVMCACMAGETSFSGMADYAELNHGYFEERFDLPDYGPHHDTFRYLLGQLDPNALHEWFDDMMRKVVATEGKQSSIAIDGKTIRHSGSSSLQVVSAWCTNNKMVLCSDAIASGTNEITAIPSLLEKLDLSARVVTIDAIAAQRSICQKIIDQDGDYCISLKKNQKTLYEDVAAYFDEKADIKTACFEHADKAHGRLEIRKCRVIDDLEWMHESHQWPGLSSIIELERVVEKKGKTTRCIHYYITSLEATPERLLTLIRDHWQIENKLHWVLDVSFNQDKACITTENSVLILDILSKLAINIFNASKPDKKSIRSMQRSCWNPSNPLRLLFNFYLS